MAQYELNLRDYIRIARKRRFMIAFSAICLGCFSYFFANMQRPTPLYTTAASVKIEQTTTMTGLYTQSRSDDTDVMETQSTVIKSLPLMEKVAKEMGVIDENLTPAEIRVERQYLDKVLRIKRMVSTDIEGWTNILNIKVKGTNPLEVVNLANTVARVFKEENTKEKNKRTIDAKNFIEKRLSEVEADLASVQQKIKVFKEENKFIDEMMEVTGLLKSIEDGKVMLEQIVDRIATTSHAIRELEDQLSKPRDKAIGLVADQKADPVFYNQNLKRNELLTKREVLLVNYTEQYSEVINLDIQLKEAESSMLSHLKEQKSFLDKTKKSMEADIKKLTERHKQLPQMAFTLDDLEYELENTRELYRDLSSKHQEILIKSSEMIEEVSIVRPALQPQWPINPPKIGATAAIGTMVGLILGIVIAFVLETLDTSIGTIEDVENFLGVPVLGVIPLIRPEDIRSTLAKKGDLEQTEESMEMNARLISHFAPKSNLAESFRALRTSIKFLVLEKNIKTLMVTSSTAREGKSTTMANMALTLAQIGSRVLLVDADLRKPMVNRVFGIEKEPGLSDIILGNYDWHDTIKTVTDIMMGRLGMEDIMTSPGIDNLNIITAGTHAPNTTELVSSQRMSDFLNEAKEEFDVVLVDAAPVLQATDSVIISTKVDAVVLVYWAGKVQRGALKRSKTQLDNVKATTIGLVLNGLKPEVSSDYKYYGYYSYYGYGDSGKEEKTGVIDKIKSRIVLPIFISKMQIKFNNFLKEKEIVSKLGIAAAPLKKLCCKIFKSNTFLRVELPFVKLYKIISAIPFVRRVAILIPFNKINYGKLYLVFKILLTVGASFFLIAGIIWQMFYS